MVLQIKSKLLNTERDLNSLLMISQQVVSGDGNLTLYGDDRFEPVSWVTGVAYEDLNRIGAPNGI